MSRKSTKRPYQRFASVTKMLEDLECPLPPEVKAEQVTGIQLTAVPRVTPTIYIRTNIGNNVQMTWKTRLTYDGWAPFEPVADQFVQQEIKKEIKGG